MNDEERRKWLDGLKEGDMVFVRERNQDREEWWCRKTVQIANDRYVGLDGRLFSRSDGERGRCVLYSLDDESAREAHDRDSLDQWISQIWNKAEDQRNLPITKIRKLLAVLEEP